MPIRETKVFLVECSLCDYKDIVYDYARLPYFWKQQTVIYGDDAQGKISHDVCPNCVKKFVDFKAVIKMPP